ncbi:quinohemoprotein amine dehydrogenase subunit alpha [Granulicella arctica]|uniref:quinohemoprotein amine dehydrogenase subunit alpha n=1 Tax=Granulicella arctica TaxID=940613 RepID=UPI0021E05FEF|nr:quinohemoprotein amine dehydrogenase subunit alpha [Granulicella arctica]
MSCFSCRRCWIGTKFFTLLLVGAGLTAGAIAQRARGTAITGGKEVHDVLIPVTDPLVMQKCGTCHSADALGNLTRISSVRTTPEGWEEAIKRMVRLNGLQVTPEEARKIVRYLSDSHGLAPEEAAAVEYFPEHRLVDEKFPDDDTQHACASCHALAKPLSWRRTPEDWDLLKNMHMAFFPSIEGSFRRGGFGARAEPVAPGTEAPKQPVDIALAYIKKSTPLTTPEWSNWVAMEETPKLAGAWLVSGSLPGKGKFYGEMKIEAKSDDGGYTTHTKVNFTNGSTWTGEGSSLVYTGYAWRGRSKGDATVAGIDDPNGVREVMMLSKDQSELTGRWFWGTYQEFGLDVTMRRETAAPTVLGTDIGALKTGSTDNTVRVFGTHLPAGLTAADVTLGSGVTVTKVVSSTPEMVTVLASVDAKAVPGRRVVSVANDTLPNAYAVYDHMDFLKVSPTTGIAHLGSDPHAKGYMQFEATAFSNGPDGKPNTPDDIDLGFVPASWKMEEFVASYGDDDIQFVGALDAKTGFFTPASDGPNPKRKSMRNNYGDVWTVATFMPPGATVPLVGRSYFIIAVPQYMQWDQPEVGQ